MTYKYLACVLAILLMSSTATAGMYRDINTTVQERELDLPIHIAAGGAISMCTYNLLPDSMSEKSKMLLALLTPLVIGTVKESFDKNFDHTDILEYGYGAGVFFVYKWKF